MEESLSIGTMAQQKSSHTQAHLRQLSAESLSSPTTGRSESQPIYRCCQGFSVINADISATFWSLRHSLCSVLSWAAWIKPSLCRALCAHLGHRCCLKRFLCGRHCVSVAMFASVRWGAGGQRLTAPTVVLQAPGWVGACQQFDWRGLFDTSEAANHILPASP